SVIDRVEMADRKRAEMTGDRSEKKEEMEKKLKAKDVRIYQLEGEVIREKAKVLLRDAKIAELESGQKNCASMLRTAPPNYMVN
ncbi:hypothetical protein PFISCL1PPCAC_19454, partial [Pristionchus fissidentatus]